MTTEQPRSAGKPATTHRRGWLLTIAIFAIALTTIAATEQTSASPRSDTAAEARLIELTNELRAQHHLEPLSTDPQLTTVARGWAEHMTSSGDLAHNPNLRTEITGNWARAGENVGYASTITELFEKLTASPSHRANLLDPTFTTTGVGVINDNGLLWVSQTFKLTR